MSNYNLSDETLAEFWRGFAIDGQTPRNFSDYEYLVKRKARREMFAELHRLTGGNQCKAARALNTSPGHIRKKLGMSDLDWRRLPTDHPNDGPKGDNQ
jgi:hypothetical protein